MKSNHAMNPDELLKSIMENRRGKGLTIAPTDAQIMQIWESQTFPVSVPTEPPRIAANRRSGEARESNARVSERPRPMDSRGGESFTETRRNVNPTGRAPFGWHLCK